MGKMMAALLAVICLSACSLESAGPPEQDLPELTVKLGGEDEPAVRGSYCWTEGGTSACADASGDPFDYERFSGMISARTGTEVELLFSLAPQSSRVSVQLEDGRGSQVSSGQVRIPDEPGRYGYTVFAQWPQGDVSYFFIVEAE
jgi:hypothetical protein